MSRLFEPWSLGPLRLDNRIVVAPMCQYSAHEGAAGDWHLMHLGSLALSGAGLLVVEATAVSPEGRITTGDLGLYDDACEAGLARVLGAVRTHSPARIALQLSHAGRKGSTRAPWHGGTQVAPDQPGGWPTEAPSALPHNPGDVAPQALDKRGLARIREAFAAAARRARRLGLDGIELHAAHGYLLHQFLSPLAYRRTDAYGGSLANRMRFPLEVFDAVREAFGTDGAVWVRVSATDWTEGGWSLGESVELARALRARGCAAMHVSTGGVAPAQAIAVGPGYQVPFARHVREHAGLPVIAVGLITEPLQAQAILERGDADAVALGRALLFNPRWPWHAAAQLGARVAAPQQYWRSSPRGLPNLFSDQDFVQAPGPSG